MTLSSVAAFITFTSSKTTFSTDGKYSKCFVRNNNFISAVSAAIAAFVLTIVANIWAWTHNEVAISAIFSGVILMVPGTLGVKSATRMFDAGANDGGTAFGIDMILRVITIALGIYVANVFVYPINKELQNKILSA
jgi:uncharacterized membrane protein YjjB (DUF3815 family)